MRKYILKHTQMTNRFHSKIILHNYILYQGQPSYIEMFPVYLRMPPDTPGRQSPKADTPSTPPVNRQTSVKTLPPPYFVCGW